MSHAADALPMSFQSVHFFLFLPLAVAGYFVLPKVLRRPFLLLASYWYYLFAAPGHLVVLLFGTLLCYGLARFIDAAPTHADGSFPRSARSSPGAGADNPPSGASIRGGTAAPAAPKDTARTHRLILSVVLMVLFLCFFKYNAFFAPVLSRLYASLGWQYPQSYFTTGEAIGISFYTFTALGYLIDLARRDVPCEKNLLNHALFLGFFPSVTMGPISRAGQLMPQLKDDTRRFDVQDATAALRRMGLGLFKKLAVADTLGIFTKQIYDGFVADPAGYQGFTLTLAAIAFAVQLYFDFSGYSDIAIGCARLFGVKLPENFNNPYFSTNFSAFWARWHITLSSFLQDYVFTPLVWSRWTEKLPVIGKRVTKPPVLSSLLLTFLLSGLWHGDTFPYIIWGLLMAAYRIGEELLHRHVGKPKKNPSNALRRGKTAVVLVLWVESLVFFKMGMTNGGTATAGLWAILRQFVPAGPGAVWQNVTTAVQTGFYNDSRIALCFILFSLVCTGVALWTDWYQWKHLSGGPLGDAVASLPTARRWAVYIGIVLCVLAGFIAQSGGYGGAAFLYGGY